MLDLEASQNKKPKTEGSAAAALSRSRLLPLRQLLPANSGAPSPFSAAQAPPRPNPHPMGASESLLARQPQQQPRSQWADEITTVSDGRRDAADEDPLLRRIRSLTIAPPLLSGQPAAGSETEPSFTDILVRKPTTASSAVSGNMNPNLIFELFAMYREWQEEMAKEISGKQGEIENKIETADALSVKLLQRFNYSVTSMRSTSHNLAEVHPLQVEVGELKGRLTEVISNCDALCKRITLEGPESLRTSVQPFTTGKVESGGGSLDPKQDP